MLKGEKKNIRQNLPGEQQHKIILKTQNCTERRPKRSVVAFQFRLLRFLLKFIISENA